MNRDRVVLVIVAIIIVILGISLINIIPRIKSSYVYVARGIQCQEFDKEANTLRKCDDSVYGQVEIINPVSVLKIKVE